MSLRGWLQQDHGRISGHADVGCLGSTSVGAERPATRVVHVKQLAICWGVGNHGTRPPDGDDSGEVAAGPTQREHGRACRLDRARSTGAPVSFPILSNAACPTRASPPPAPAGQRSLALVGSPPPGSCPASARQELPGHPFEPASDQRVSVTGCRPTECPGSDVSRETSEHQHGGARQTVVTTG